MSLRSAINRVDLDALLTKVYFDQIVGTINDVYPAETIHANINRGRTEWCFVNSKETVVGSEVTLEELAYDEFPGVGESDIEVWLSLLPMGGADTIIIREYLWEPYPGPAGSYHLYASHTYSGVQSEPAIHFAKKNVPVRWKITAEQTAGIAMFLYWYAYYRAIYPHTP